MKKVANFLANILIVVLVVLLLAILVLRFGFGVEFKAVLTASMEPELPVGSLLGVAPVAYEEIAIGDDITFVRDENLTLVTHRVIAKDDASKKITTQGIANTTPDAPTLYDNVVGKVVFHIPVVGYLAIWTSTLQGKIIAVIIIVSLVAFSLLFSGDGDKESETRKSKGGNDHEGKEQKDSDRDRSDSADSGALHRGDDGLPDPPDGAKGE